MTLTVETGVGLANADSYVSAADALSYATANGLAWPTDVPAQEAAVRRATMWIDATYRSRFPGYRRNRRLQALEWPRVQAFALEGGGNGPSPAYYGDYGVSPYAFDGVFDPLPFDSVPAEIVKATIEAAAREVAAPGTLMGDVDVSKGQLKSEAAGDTKQEWFLNNAGVAPTSSGLRFPVIDAILAGILIQQSGFTARAARA